MDFSILLKDARTKKGLSVDELSQKASISSSTLLAFEEGRMLPYITDLTVICRALDVTPNDLLLNATFDINKNQVGFSCVKHPSIPKFS